MSTRNGICFYVNFQQTLSRSAIIHSGLPVFDIDFINNYIYCHFSIIS